MAAGYDPRSIILYGLAPSEDAHFPELQPALSLHCIVTFVKELQPGQCVSYGRTFTADHPMRGGNGLCRLC